MKSNIPSISPNPKGEFECPSTKCRLKGKGPFRNKQAFNMHWMRTHSKTIVNSVETRKAKKARESYRNRRQQAALVAASNDGGKAREHTETPQTAPTVFSYFCPICGTPNAVILHKEECPTCKVPQGPIQMGINLSVRSLNR